MLEDNSKNDDGGGGDEGPGKENHFAQAGGASGRGSNGGAMEGGIFFLGAAGRVFGGSRAVRQQRRPLRTGGLSVSKGQSGKDLRKQGNLQFSLTIAQCKCSLLYGAWCGWPGVAGLVSLSGLISCLQLLQGRPSVQGEGVMSELRESADVRFKLGRAAACRRP